MGLKEQIISDMTQAMKSQEKLKLETLRMMKAEIMKYEVSGADKKATDEIVLGLIQKGVKQRMESAEAFKKGGKEEMATKELDEIKILEFYLPSQFSAEEVKAVIEEIIKETNATAKEFGKVMSAAMAKLKGRADGKVVGEAVKALLK